jgi:hypothetical protein
MEYKRKEPFLFVDNEFCAQAKITPTGDSFQTTFLSPMHIIMIEGIHDFCDET